MTDHQKYIDLERRVAELEKRFAELEKTSAMHNRMLIGTIPVEYPATIGTITVGDFVEMTKRMD